METHSFSGDLELFVNNQGMSNGDHLRPFDGSTEFNISYHKVDGTSNEDISKGKSHISQLRADLEFTHVFDETTHFHRTDPSLQVVDDVDLDMEYNARQTKRNHLRKMDSQPGSFNSGELVLGGDLDPMIARRSQKMGLEHHRGQGLGRSGAGIEQLSRRLQFGIL